MHDIWHILTGYHRDALGEACLVAFSYAQTKGLGWALIAARRGLARARRQGLSRTKAHLAGLPARQGRAWLLGEDYERLMAEPLEAARRAAEHHAAPRSTTPSRRRSATACRRQPSMAA